MLKFEATQKSYAIEIDDDAFTALEDSESYVTNHAAFEKGNETLCDKLKPLPGVWDVEYNGHFGACIYMKIDLDEDSAKLRNKISKIIEKHLKWCQTIEVVEHVKKRRAG